jgi:uncharacterized delta-60 repeat protein
MFTPFAFIKRQVSAAIATIQKVLIAGNFTSFRTISYGGLIKTTPTTSIDTTFNMGSGTNGSIYASTIDENGKILIGGTFTLYSGSSQNYITRINTDGTRDATFNIGTGFSNTTWAVLPVSQSKVLVGGSWSATYSGSTSVRITRINSNGTLDATFNPPTLNNVVYTVATQSDGKIIAGGAFTNQGYTEPFLAKITPQLDPDTAFNPGVGPGNAVYTFASQSDGKIIFGGAFTTYSGSSANRIERINTDGTIDTSFNQGVGFNGDVFAIKIQPDGKILVGGSFSSYSGSASQNRIIRLNSNGTRDTTFNPGAGVTNTIYDLQLQSDNKIIAVGVFSTTYSGSTSPRIVRINPDGTKDFTFNMGTTGFSATQYSAQIQNDGKIIVVGSNATYSGSAAQRIRRINTNGTLDTTFNIGTAGLNNTTYRAKIQPDQKIVVMGSFTSYSGSAVTRITRINPDGTRDLTFNVGTGFNTAAGQPAALELDSSGNIYAGSTFTTYSGSTANSFVKISPSGSIITGSGLYNGFDNEVNALLVDSAGSVYAGGAFSNYIQPTNYIIRLNTDGTKDTSFNIGTGFSNIVNNLVVQSDDKIIVGGNFTSYSGSANNYIVRLNTDGTKDTSFNIGTGFSSFVYKVFLQSDNKILVGGVFTSYSGSSNNNLVRINPNGTKDTSFNIGTGTNSSQLPIGIVQDQSGNIHYGNVNMTSYSGSSVTGYVKLTSSGSIDPTFLSTAANTNSLPGAYTQGTSGTGVYSISIDSSNNAYLFGNFSNYLTPSSSYLSSSRITALDLTQGDVSTPPNLGTGFNGSVLLSSTTPSGDIWLSGYATTYKGSSLNNSTLIKIDSQGTLINTSSLYLNTLWTGAPPSAIFAQSDGKVLFGFEAFPDGTSVNMLRINPDGTFDNTFSQTQGYFQTVYTIKQQSNGNIIMGGSFYTSYFDGENYVFDNPSHYVILNSSGSALYYNYDINNPVYNINVLPDDSFIMTGETSIVKLNPTSSLDPSYNVGSGFNNFVYTSTLQPDGKLIAAGIFSSYSGSAVNKIARINTNGTLDTTFNPGSGFDIFNTRSSKIVVDQENNIHVVGPFTTYSGSVVNGYVKLLPNGNIHPQYTGSLSRSPIGTYTPNFPNKDAYTMELLNY